MPGYKLTMLPDAVVQAYTLTEGRDCPAVSLYVTLDEATLAVDRERDAARARADRRQPAPRQARRRGHRGDAHRRARRPTTRSPPNSPSAFRLARHLKAQREVVRGKPEIFNRPDYNFRLDGDDGARAARRRARARSPRASAARRST